MSEENLSNIDLGEKLNEILGNKDLMTQIASLAGTKTEEAPQKSAPSLDGLLSNPDILAKLPEIMNIIKPMVSHSDQKKPESGPDKRIALLMALKPYLSSERCDAVDYIAKMSKLSDLLKNLNI